MSWMSSKVSTEQLFLHELHVCSLKYTLYRKLDCKHYHMTITPTFIEIYMNGLYYQGLGCIRYSALFNYFYRINAPWK